MNYLHAKFHMHVSSSSLVTITKLKTKYRFHAFIMLFIFILQKNYLNKSDIFFIPLLAYIISRPYIKLC